MTLLPQLVRHADPLIGTRSSALSLYVSTMEPFIHPPLIRRWRQSLAGRPRLHQYWYIIHVRSSFTTSSQDQTTPPLIQGHGSSMQCHLIPDPCLLRSLPMLSLNLANSLLSFDITRQVVSIEVENTSESPISNQLFSHHLYTPLISCMDLRNKITVPHRHNYTPNKSSLFTEYNLTMVPKFAHVVWLTLIHTWKFSSGYRRWPCIIWYHTILICLCDIYAHTQFIQIKRHYLMQASLTCLSLSHLSLTLISLIHFFTFNNFNSFFTIYFFTI